MRRLAVVALAAALLGGCAQRMAAPAPQEGEGTLRIVATAIEGPTQAPARPTKGPQVHVQAVKPGSIVIDGNLDDWPKTEPMKATIPEDPSTLSACAWVAFDETNLYLAFDVEDDVFSQEFANGDIWKGDSVQFAIDANNDKSEMHYKSDDYEYGLALVASDGGQAPLVWRWRAGASKPTGPVPNAKLAVVRKNGGAVYEVAVPITELEPFSRGIQQAVGFTWVVNDSDGGMRSGFAEWTPGIAASKDPSSFGELVFEPIVPSSEEPLIVQMRLLNLFADEPEDFEVELGANARSSMPVEVTATLTKDGEVKACGTQQLTLPKGISWHKLAVQVRGVDPARYHLLVSVRERGREVKTSDFVVYKYNSNL